MTELQKTPATSATPQAGVRPRLDAVDLLRGLVMIVMALDHTRDFFSNQLSFDPTDLDKTDPALFLTRWVTHFCAPVFIFLAGTGAFLYGQRGRTKRQIAGFLASRGAWLVVLEHTVVHVGWFYNFDFTVLYCGVLWALGWSMILLAPLVLLPLGAVTTIGIALIAGHHLIDDSTTWWGILLHNPGGIDLGFCKLLVMYTLIPWVGVMAAGYGFGIVWTWEHARRRRCLVGLGAAMIAGFVAIRFVNGYGELKPWSGQPTPLFTVFSFLNTTKYPPSLCYILMTLGPAMWLLAVFDRPTRTPGAMGRVAVTFGRVPLFYYLLQWPLIHGLAIVVHTIRDGAAPAWHFLNPDQWAIPEGYGFRIEIVWLIWLGVVCVLYLPCRWFAGVKARRRDWWLSYL
jgi:uncharacterized membrane protein